MENRLRNYFPLIRERKEVLKEIGESSGLQACSGLDCPNGRKSSWIL
ncbi:MAG: hypothetical protein ACLSA0_13580 [Eisenbergiella massiliensis]